MSIKKATLEYMRQVENDPAFKNPPTCFEKLAGQNGGTDVSHFLGYAVGRLLSMGFTVEEIEELARFYAAFIQESNAALV